jgi:hypothetical protein
LAAGIGIVDWAAGAGFSLPAQHGAEYALLVAVEFEVGVEDSIHLGKFHVWHRGSFVTLGRVLSAAARNVVGVHCHSLSLRAVPARGAGGNGGA